jgi:renalase
MFRVAVIGAGIAGLSCAARLADAGCRVDVFEKSRGTGGRLNTRRDHGTGFDQGAQYFTARDPRFRTQVEIWREAGAVARWDVQPYSIDATGRASPSPDDTTRWVGTPAMSAITQQLAGRDLALCTQTRITSVTRSRGSWTLTSENHLSFTDFHALVVAVPAPQAGVFLGASPTLAAVAHAAVMEPCWSVAMGFDQPTGVAMDAAFARGQPVSWLARDSGKPGRTPLPETWVLHAASGWTEEHLEAPAEAVAKHLHRWFASVVAPTAPAPVWLHAHRWRFARTVHAVPDAHHFDASAQLGICGDWCGGGRVEGAWLSGRSLASTLLAAHRL